MSDDHLTALRRILLEDLSARDVTSAASLRALEELLGRAAKASNLSLPEAPEAARGIEDLVPTPAVSTPPLGGRGPAGPVTLLRHEAGPRLLDAARADPAIRNLQPAEVLGPFRDRLGRDVVIDVLRPVRKVALRTSASATPWLLFTRARLPRAGETSVAIRAGTVWIAASALVAGAPANGYVGLLVEGGTLDLPSAPTISGDDLILGGQRRGRLRLTLRQPAGPTGEVTAPPPAEVTLDWTTRGVAAGLTATTVTVGAVGLAFSPANGLRHDAARGEIAWTCTVAPDRLDSAALTLGGAELAGATRLASPGWAVPITTTADPLSLPEAAGLFAWTVAFADAVTARWPGGPATPARLAAARLAIAPGSFLLQDQATPGAAGDRHRFQLWQLPGRPHRANVSVTLTAPFAFSTGWTAEGGEFVAFEGLLSGRLDRPVDAMGVPVPFVDEPVRVQILGEGDSRQLRIAATDLGRSVAPSRRMLVLENAYLAAGALRFVGMAGALHGGTEVRDARAGLLVPVLGWIPTLPDPYVDNLDPDQGSFAGRQVVANLLGLFAWEAGEAEFTLNGQLSSPTARQGNPSKGGTRPLRASDGEPAYRGQTAQGARIPQGKGIRDERVSAAPARAQPGQPAEASRAANAIFERNLTEIRLGPTALLLDVSTARHQVGVALSLLAGDTYASVSAPPPTAVRFLVQGMRLGTLLSALRVFALPQIQWEPVRTLDIDQDPVTLGLFPTPLASASDGGPTVIAANAATLAPAIPDLALDGALAAFEGGEGMTVVTTLPFGLRALVRLRPRATGGRAADTASYVRPSFDGALPLSGGLQLALEAQGGRGVAGAESPSFDGLAVQTLNGVDLLTGAPLDISVLGATVGSAGSVETLFNQEFALARPRVPVTRYDISGYGASTFSDWANPKGSYAETTRAQFQVMVGRTALEVVKVASVLYPWGIRLTRSVTIERRGGGGVLRRDSGWQAQTPGLFDFTTDTRPTQPFEIHPGLIRGIHAVERVRPLANAAIPLPGGGAVLPMAFDAEVALEGLQGPGRTRAMGLVGYLHLAPLGQPITPAALAELIRHQGAIGGPVDALVDVGGSGFVLRALRIEVGLSETAGNLRFVGAVRGAPRFGPSGAWSVVRLPGPAGGPPGDASAVEDGLPVLREGSAQPGDSQVINAPLTGPYRFADPADLFAGATPATDYGLLQGDTTHRFLFRRPILPAGTRRLESALPPAFVDFFAATSSKGLFPPIANAIQLTDRAYRLEVQPGTGFLGLQPAVDLTAPRPDLVMSETVADAFRIAYGGARLRFSLGPTDWSLEFDRLELWTDTADVPQLSGTRVKLQGGTGRRAQLDRIQTLMSPVLEGLFNALPMMGNRGTHGPVDLGATNLKVGGKFTAGLDTIIEAPPYVAIRLYALLEFAEEIKSGSPAAVSLGAKTGYEARFSIPIEPYPVAVIFGWQITLGGKVYLKGPDAGKTKGLIEARIYIGLAFGKDLGPFKATVATGAGLIIIRGSEMGIGGFIFLEINAKLDPVVKLKITGEFACLQIEKPDGKYHRWSGSVGINVSFFMVISIKMSADVSDEKKVD